MCTSTSGDVHVKYIFGPVASRRLKRSLGVDLVPYKTCSFDCIYCELGRTTCLTVDRNEYVPYDEIITNLANFLQETLHPPDYITLGGSGEPTLHSQIGRIISEIKNITSIPVAILTNASTLFQDDVKDELMPADIVLPSLDAVTPSAFEFINRPHPSLTINDIVRGLIDFNRAFAGELWLEVLFCQGINDESGETTRLREAIKEINPDKVQLNTVDRPPAQDFVVPVSGEKLAAIQRLFGERAEIISGSLADKPQSPEANPKFRVFDLLSRRPCTVDDMVQALGFNRKELGGLLALLLKEGKILSRLYNNQRYFRVIQK